MLFSEASNGHMLAEVLAEGSSSAASSARGTLRGIAMLVTPTAKLATGYTDQARLIIAAFVIVLVSELIGIVNVPVGPGKIVLLPMLWALLIGAVWSVAGDRLPAPLQIGTALQRRAAAIVQIGVLIFVAKLGLLVGASLPKLATAGWALIFQELGHFFGTMALGLPLALILGIKREAIGATFSIGREPSIAIIAEKYGMQSAEGRGVLAEYITGTILGAAFIALLASFVVSLGIFNPLALAMGAGVGSGSMMTAASAAIAALQTPEVAKEVAAFAAASNLMTTVVGIYFTLYISLPFTTWAYAKLEPLIGRTTAASTTTLPEPIDAADHPVAAAPHVIDIGHVLMWIAVGLIALTGNWITFKTAPDAEVIGGLAIIIAVVMAGYALYALTRSKIAAIVWVSVIAMLLTFPGLPTAASVAALTGKINFVALATPILAFAGLAVAKDLPAFRKLGWRIVVVSLAANAGTFLGATVIAQALL